MRATDRVTPGERLYRALIYLYPPRFRREYHTDLIDSYRSRRTELGSRPGARVALAIHIASDLARSVPRELLGVLGIGAGGSGSRRRVGRSRLQPGGLDRSRPGHAASLALGDVRLAVRALARKPGFSVAVIATLALGIGANTAIFSIVNGMLLTPLPYPEPHRLVGVYQQNASGNRWNLSVADFLGIRERQRAFDNVGAIVQRNAIVTGGERPEWVRAGFITAGTLATLGVEPTEGRAFRDGEDAPGAAPTVVLGDRYRRSRFGAGDAIGRVLTLDGVSYTVVGVLPAGVDRLAGARGDVWPVLTLEPPRRRGPFFLRAVARMKPDVTLSRAVADLGEVSDALFPIWAEGFQDRSARLTPIPLRDAIVGNAGQSVLIVFGAVGFLLLVSIANVSNLVLARAAERARETAVRRAMGARRGRLAQWLLAEGMVLSTLGAAAGLALAWLGVELFRSGAVGLPRMESVRLDASTLAFTAALVVTTGFICGLAPLLLASGRDVAGTLKRESRGGSTGRRAQAFRNGLVVLEFGLTLPLVAAAGLLASSLFALQQVDPGYDPDGLLSVRLTLPRATYPDVPAIGQFWAEALEEARTIPGVESAGATTGLPPDQPTWTNNFNLLDRPVEAGQPEPVSPWVVATPEYLATLGIPLLEGRLLEEADRGEGAPAVVVSETWAARYYPGESALGRQMVNGGCTECTPTTVVGVVGDVKYRGLSGDGEAVYEPGPNGLARSMSLVVRATDEGSALDAIRERLRRLDPDLPVASAETFRDRLRGSVAQPRQWTLVLGLFAAIGLLLSAVGIYGVLAYFVRQQQREIGVRMALGARPAGVVAMVLRRGLARALAGVALGLLAAVAVARWIESLLFQVHPTDPLVLAGVSLLLLAVALMACLVPGRRAARVDPVRAIASD